MGENFFGSSFFHILHHYCLIQYNKSSFDKTGILILITCCCIDYTERVQVSIRYRLVLQRRQYVNMDLYKCYLNFNP